MLLKHIYILLKFSMILVLLCFNIARVKAIESYVISNKLEPTDLTHFLQEYHSMIDLEPHVVLDSMALDTNFKRLNSTSFGFSNQYYWFKFKIINSTTAFKESEVVIKNPHIDFIKIWSIDWEGSLKMVYLGGDGMPFNDRTIRNRNIVFPVSLLPNQEMEYLIQVDKRNASVSVPIKILPKKIFEKTERINLFVFGLYFGVLALIILFAVFIFFILRQSVFVWYAIYLVFLELYLMSDIGYLFQIVYPNKYYLNNYSRPVFVSLMVMAFLQFTRELLNIKALLPKWNTGYNLIIGGLGLTTLIWVVTLLLGVPQTILFLNIQNLTLFIAFIYFMTTAILTYKKQQQIILFFLGAFMALILSAMLIVFIENGWVNESDFPFNPLFIGSIIETIVFGVAVSYWSKLNERQRIKLINEIPVRKKEKVDSYLLGIEEEKSKISSDLHDNIGSRISSLKRQIEADKEISKEVVEKIKVISKRVRRISHELSPPSFYNNEFTASLKHLVYSHQAKGMQINFQLFDIPSVLDKELFKQLYRIIQGLLSDLENSKKYKKVDIQLFNYESELVLAIESNVYETSYNKVEPGFVMKSILNRVELLNGRIDVSSFKRYGTSIMIHIPISNDQLTE